MSKKIIAATAAVCACIAMFATACAGKTESVVYAPGTFSDETYTNTVLGVKANFNSSEWKIADEDYLAEMNETDGGSAEDLKKALEENDMVFEFMATKESGTNVSVSCVAGTLMSEDRYAEASIPGIKEEAEASGYELADEDINKSKVTFAGTEHSCIDAKVGYSGMEIWEKMVIFRKGQYIYMFTITALTESEANEIANMFEPING